MPIDIIRTSVNMNGVAIPGISRNGQFLTEQPIESLFMFRTPALAAGVAKSFKIDFSGVIELALCIDTGTTTNFTFTVVTPENVTYVMELIPALTTKYGNTRVLNLPKIPIDKGSTVSILSSTATTQMTLFVRPAIRLDTIDF